VLRMLLLPIGVQRRRMGSARTTVLAHRGWLLQCKLHSPRPRRGAVARATGYL